jgi:hypothetical protein
MAAAESWVALPADADCHYILFLVPPADCLQKKRAREHRDAVLTGGSSSALFQLQATGQKTW